MKKTRMMVYPYGQKEISFGRLAEMTEREFLLVSPKGWGYAGKDINSCDGGPISGRLVGADPKEGIRQAEEVLFVENEELSLQHYMELLEYSQKLGKRIYITKCLALKIQQKKQAVCFTDIEILGEENEASMPENVGTRLKLLQIPVPVIAVAGVGERCNQFELLLATGQYFQKKGYRVLMLGTREYGSLFGAECLPDYAREDDGRNGNRSLRERIINLNLYVYDRVKKTKAEILLIEIPGSLMLLNPYVFEDFGERAFLFHTAVSADAGILSLYAHPYTEKFLEHMMELCHYRYNMPVDCIHVSNTSFEVSQDTFEKEYMTLDSKWIDEHKASLFNSQIPLFHWLKDESLQAMCKSIELKLTNQL